MYTSLPDDSANVCSVNRRRFLQLGTVGAGVLLGVLTLSGLAQADVQSATPLAVHCATPFALSRCA